MNNPFKIKHFVKFAFLFLLLGRFISSAQAQEVEWLMKMGNTSTASITQTIERDGKILMVVKFNGNFIIGNRTFTGITGAESNYAFLLFAENGTLLKDYFYRPQNHAQRLDFSKVVIDSKGEFYATGTFRGRTLVGNNISTSSQFPDGGFILKLNANLLPLWIDCFGLPGGHGLNGPLVEIALDNSEAPIIAFDFNGTQRIGSTQSTFSSGSQSFGNRNIALIKYHRLGYPTRVNVLSSAGNQSLLAMGSSNGILKLFFSSQGKVFYNGKDFFGNTVTGLFEIDASSLNLQKVASFDNAFQPTMLKPISTGTRFVFAGRTRTFINHDILDHMIYGIIGDDNTVEWVKQSTGNGRAFINDISVFTNGEIYVSGIIENGSRQFENHQFFSSSFANQSGFYLRAQADGKITSAEQLNPKARISSVSSSKTGIFLSGSYTDTLTMMGNTYTRMSGMANTAYMAYLPLYDVKLSNAPKSSFCAGETFDIKFSAKGEFGKSNKFILELSDPNGSINGTWREIGSGDSSSKGVISASLPAKNMKTGFMYRLRLRTTAPEGFSNVTFPISIHSRDSASAGDIIYFCPGEEIELSATGGSIWHWSPSTFFVNKKDTSFHSPQIKPEQPITYRLIINGDNQCGFKDTAYVELRLKLPPTVRIEGPSSFCPNQLISLDASIPNAKEGDYTFEWRNKGMPHAFSNQNSFNLFPSTDVTFELTVKDRCNNVVVTDHPLTRSFSLQAAIEGKPACKDRPAILKAVTIGCNEQESRYFWTERGKPNIVLSTSQYFYPEIKSTTTFDLRIEAGRTNLTATASYTLTIDSSFTAKSTRDTLVCLGSPIFLNAWAETCDNTEMEYRWTNNRNSDVLTTASILINPEDDIEYTVWMRNTHNNLQGSAKTKVRIIKAPLTLNKLNDTLICSGEKIQLRASANGGYAPGYQFRWEDELGKGLNGNAPTVNPLKDTRYKVVLTDGCNSQSLQKEMVVQTRKPLSLNADFQDINLCYGEELEVKLYAEGGLSNQYQWNISGNGMALNHSNGNLIIKSKKSELIHVSLEDVCSAPAANWTFNVKVKDPLSASIIHPSDVCENEEILLQVNAAGGNGLYQNYWHMADGKIVTQNDLRINAKYGETIGLRVEDGCSSPSEIVWLPMPVKQPLKVEINGPNEICENENVRLEAITIGGNSANYKYQWNGVSNSSNKSSVQFTAKTNSSIVFTANDGCSPEGKASFNLNVAPLPVTKIAVENDNYCYPMVLSAKDISMNNEKNDNVWKLNNKIIRQQDLKEPIHKGGNYTLQLITTNNLGCSDSAAIRFVAVESPKKELSINPHTIYIGGEVTFSVPQDKIATVKWTFNGIDIKEGRSVKYIFNQPGENEFHAEITNEEGCSVSQRGNIFVNEDVKIFIPNAFRPSSPFESNRIFKPFIDANYKYSLIISARTGEIIVNCEGTNCSWDGSYKGVEAPGGIYLYSIKYQLPSGESREERGYVTLLR